MDSFAWICPTQGMIHFESADSASTPLCQKRKFKLSRAVQGKGLGPALATPPMVPSMPDESASTCCQGSPAGQDGSCDWLMRRAAMSGFSGRRLSSLSAVLVLRETAGSTAWDRSRFSVKDRMHISLAKPRSTRCLRSQAPNPGTYTIIVYICSWSGII